MFSLINHWLADLFTGFKNLFPLKRQKENPFPGFIFLFLAYEFVRYILQKFFVSRKCIGKSKCFGMLTFYFGSQSASLGKRTVPVSIIT